MRPKNQISLVSLKNQNICFWSCGNKPTQELFGLTGDEVLMHLKCLYLLYDKIVCAASFYFESEITQTIAQSFNLLFKRGEILFFVDDEIEDFVEHGRLKTEKSPKELSAYSNKTLVLEKGKELNSFGHILKRPSYSISDRIVQLWVKDVVSRDEGTIGEYLVLFYKNKDELKRIESLIISIAKNREKDFVWDYINLRLKNINLPKHILYHMRKRLSQMYCLSTSEYLGINVDQPDHAFSGKYIDSSSRYDTCLFLDCMRILKVDKAIEKLNSKNLISLKKSQEFIFFKEFYLLLINTAAYHKRDIAFFLPLYREAALKFPTSLVTYEKFLEMFGTLCKAIKKDIQDQERPLELLINTYRLFNRQPLEDFINKISKLSLSDKPIFYEGEDKLMVNQEVTKDKTDKNIFISYSRKDLKWLERLQIHLKPIERKGIINRWDDTMIKVGSKWREEIKTAIINADAAILLVSADFLASDFIVNNELPPLLKSAQLKGIKILPLIVSHCLFSDYEELSQFQAFNPPSEPMIKMAKAKQEATFVQLSKVVMNIS